MDSSETPPPKTPLISYTQLLKQKLQSLNDANFWEYMLLYGVIHKNNHGCRIQACHRLMNASFVDQCFAAKELMYLQTQFGA